jgi:hypothetical protein
VNEDQVRAAVTHVLREVAPDVDVPERDYPQIVTLAGCTRYLLAHLPA